MRRKYVLYIACITIFSFLLLSKGIAFGNSINLEDVNNNLKEENNFLEQSNLLTGSITFLVYLLIFVIILSLAYLTTRWIGKQNMKYVAKSKYMEIVDILSLGAEKNICIVKTPQGFMVIGVTKEGISLLEKLGKEEAELIKEVEANHESLDKNFGVYLNSYLSKLKSNFKHNNSGGLK